MDGEAVMRERPRCGGRRSRGEACVGLALLGGALLGGVLLGCEHAPSAAPPAQAAVAVRAPSSTPSAPGSPAPGALPAPAGASAFPSDAEVRQILVERVATDAASYGIVVGLVGPQGPRRVIGYGSRGVGVPGPMDGDTVFEIGSMTKVFTSLLLADAVGRGEVSLDDPVSKFLPATVRMPERGGRRITLVDLATHTSGLPRLPSNMKPADPENPYAD